MNVKLTKVKEGYVCGDPYTYVKIDNGNERDKL